MVSTTGEVDDVVRAHWALAAGDLSDFIWGHASQRAASGDGVLTKSSGWAFEEIDAGKVIEVSWDGKLISGTGNVHIEVPIHTQIMRAQPAVNAVVHCHTPSVTAFASLDQPLRPLSHEGVLFADNLPRFTLTGDLIRTPELGDALAAELGSAPAALMVRHGLVAVGPDLATAVMHAVLLDRACRVQLTAAAAGGPLIWSDEEEVRAKRTTVFQPFEKTYRYLVDVGRRLHERATEPTTTPS
ncbi:class II aldolase/adducin family protein [Amycolatopsis pithecellobii]|uniref:Class II aldolase/adducin family protein n=1 Tax=Amycolatopsis pithecellobii TaxID=664692 RepID=A0A6N7YW21_9PSEU|nr:class II aldolase/adducin family protein [Amycolatopsis pithecellobii]MTD57277.1 class II aldolase/adducin family protein [Amycolatopsis pithecellobii]